MQPETEEQALGDVLFYENLEVVMGGRAIVESVQVVVFVLPLTNEGTKSSVSQNLLLNVCRSDFLSIPIIKTHLSQLTMTIASNVQTRFQAGLARRTILADVIRMSTPPQFLFCIVAVLTEFATETSNRIYSEVKQPPR